jgi:2'-5' RNA ligase
VRVAVALLLPEPLATEVDGLRRAFGADLAHVAPHITLVPPVNVRVDDLATALAVLRAGASAVSGPLTLELGPAATFAPVNPVVYLAVGGADGALLVRLRERLLTGPLARTIDLPFVPHATIADDHPPARIDAAVRAIDGFVTTCTFPTLHLLQDGASGRHRWNPVAEAALAPRVVVGRGGWELEVSVGAIADPEVVVVLEDDWSSGARPEGARPVVAAARHDGAIVAALAGWARDGEVAVAATFGNPDVVALLEQHAAAHVSSR